MLTVREMQIDDFSQIMSIETKNFSVPWTEAGFFTFFMRQDAIFLIAETAGEIVGYCGALTVLDEADILNVAVKDSRQGEGIGSRMMKALLDRLTQAGVTAVHLEVRESNHRAIHLYERMGFEAIGIRKGYYEEPAEDAITMHRR